MKHKLSILIVSYNVRALLQNCIQSIQKNEKGTDLEILVFENNSSDGSLGMLEELSLIYPNLQIIRSDENIGFARGNNELIKRTTSDYVLLLNPDTEIIKENTIGLLLEFLEKNPKVGIVGPKITYGDGKLQYSCGKMPSLFNTIAGVLSLPNLFPALFGRYRYGNWDHSELREVAWVSGACLLISGKQLHAIDGFDPELIMYAEDVDLCLRIRAMGLQVMYYPDIVIVHYEGQSSKKSRNLSLLSGFKSYLHFYKKYKGYRQAVFLKYALIAACLIKIMVLALLNILYKKQYQSIQESYCNAVPQLWAYKIKGH